MSGSHFAGANWQTDRDENGVRRPDPAWREEGEGPAPATCCASSLSALSIRIAALRDKLFGGILPATRTVRCHFAVRTPCKKDRLKVIEKRPLGRMAAAECRVDFTLRAHSFAYRATSATYHHFCPVCPMAAGDAAQRFGGRRNQLHFRWARSLLAGARALRLCSRPR